MQTLRQYLPVRDSQIYYEASGEGKPLLLLHGGLSTIEDFTFQIPELAKYFKVYAFERPGHGHTADNDEPFSYSAMTEYTVAFIEMLNLEPCHLIGFSDGAIISLLVSFTRPDLVKALVSISGNYDTSFLTADEFRRIGSITHESFRKENPVAAGRYDNASPDGSGHFPLIFEKLRTMWLNQPEIRQEALARIRAPTLVMAGDRDAIPIEHTIRLFRSIRDAQLSIIPGATHSLLSEKPTIVNSTLLNFLRTNEVYSLG